MHNWRFILQFWVILPNFQSKFDLFICFDFLINQISLSYSKNKNIIFCFLHKKTEGISSVFMNLYYNKIDIIK